MIEKKLVRMKVADLIPYERNPRKIPQEAIDDVKESYMQCGVIDPIEIDENNVSTILCNCLENFGFIFLAFVGIYDGATILTIAASTSIVEAIVALCDTPFLYLAGGINRATSRFNAST